MTQRGRPKKPITKSNVQSAREYRLRKKRGISHDFKAVVGEPWNDPSLKWSDPPREVKIIWLGDYGCYVSRSWDVKMVWQGGDQYASRFWDFCYWPAPGHARPKYCGGDPFILARRYQPYCWRDRNLHISGPSETPLGHLLGRRAWENKDDSTAVMEYDDGECDDGVTTVNAQRFRGYLKGYYTYPAAGKFKEGKEDSGVFHPGIDSNFANPKGVQFGAGHIDERFKFKKKKARCLTNPPIRKPWRRPVGPAVNVVSPEIPDAPIWRDAMADAMRFVAVREKSTPFACAWNAQAAQGDDYVSYSKERRSRMRLEPMPHGKRWLSTGERRAGWKATRAKIHCQMLAREAAGIPLRGKSACGGKSVRHVSAAYRAEIAPATAMAKAA